MNTIDKTLTGRDKIVLGDEFPEKIEKRYRRTEQVFKVIANK